MRRAALVLFVVAVVGCEALRPAQPESSAPVRAAPPTPVKPLAVPVVPQPASAVLLASAKQTAPEDELTLVARCLERGDSLCAAGHLDAYVRANPDQPLFRYQLAELYAKCDRPAEARLHYERFVTEAEGAALRPQVVAGHIKLMGIAQQSGDRFAELLHRGAGLLLLVAEQDRSADRDPVFCEEMTCKALKALTDAKELKPNDPRTRVLLADALERVGGRQAANAERAAARGRVTSDGRKVLE